MYKEVSKLRKKQVKFSPEQLASTTQIARNVSKYFDSALKCPLFIQRDQDVQWVLMSLKEYKKIVEGEEKT